MREQLQIYYDLLFRRCWTLRGGSLGTQLSEAGLTSSHIASAALSLLGTKPHAHELVYIPRVTEENMIFL